MNVSLTLRNWLIGFYIAVYESQGANDMSDGEGAAAPDTGIIFYQTEDGQSKIQVRLQDGTVWLSLRLLAELYQVSTRTIGEHIINIYRDHELLPEATIRKFRLVQTEGIRQVERLMDFYNLDMIPAIQPASHTGAQRKDLNGRGPG